MYDAFESIIDWLLMSRIGLPFPLAKLYYADRIFLLNGEPVKRFLSFFCGEEWMEDILEIRVILKA